MATLAALAGAAVARAISRSRSRSRSVPNPSNKTKRLYRAGAYKARQSRSKSRANTRSPVRTDGQGNARLASSHGRSLSRLSSTAEARIRASLTPIDTLIRQDVGIDSYATIDENAWSAYRVFEIANTNDIRKIITKSLGNNPDHDLETYIKDYSMQAKLVNQMNTVVNIRVYEYIAREDMPYGVFDDTQDCVSGSDNGFTKEDPHEVTSKTIGATLFQNSAFCTYNKIVKVRNIQLAPGKECVLTLTHQKGNKINATLFQSNNTTRRSYTRGLIIQYIGSPMSGPLAEPAGSHLAAVGPFKVVWALFKRFHFMNLNPHKGATYLEDNIPATGSGAESGAPKWGSGHAGRVMNQASGEPEVIVQA